MTSRQELAQRRARFLGPVARLSADELKREVGETFGDLASTLKSLSPQQATWKPDAEEWSAAQVGDHVVLSTGVLGNIIRLLARGQAPSDADWDPPPQFKGDPSDLEAVSRRLAELPRFTDALFAQGMITDRADVRANNSFLGDMNWREWYHFLRVHAQSHIEQIEKLRAMAGFPP